MSTETLALAANVHSDPTPPPLAPARCCVENSEAFANLVASFAPLQVASPVSNAAKVQDAAVELPVPRDREGQAEFVAWIAALEDRPQAEPDDADGTGQPNEQAPVATSDQALAIDPALLYPSPTPPLLVLARAATGAPEPTVATMPTRVELRRSDQQALMSLHHQADAPDPAPTGRGEIQSADGVAVNVPMPRRARGEAPLATVTTEDTRLPSTQPAGTLAPAVLPVLRARSETHHATSAASDQPVHAAYDGANSPAGTEPSIARPGNQTIGAIEPRVGRPGLDVLEAVLVSERQPVVEPPASQISRSITGALATLAPMVDGEGGVVEQARPAVERWLPGDATVVKALNVQLHPVELGGVDIRITLRAGSLQLHMRFEHEKSAQSVRASKAELTDALIAAGLSVDNLVIDLLRPADIGTSVANSGQPSNSVAGQAERSGAQAGPEQERRGPRSHADFADPEPGSGEGAAAGQVEARPQCGDIYV
jgi:hypothetical protein